MPFEGVMGHCVYRGLYGFSFWTLTLGFGIRVGGRGNMPSTGPVLLLANHQSFLDPWFVALAVAPRKVTHLARSNLFNGRWFEKTIRYLGAIPIDRGFGRDGLRQVLAHLDQGAVVVVFAEGERCHTGQIQPLKAGVGLLASRTHAPIVPVGIAGAFDMWPRHAKLPLPNPLVMPNRGRSVALHLGECIPPSTYHGQDREAILKDLQGRIAAAQHEAERIRRK